ncbi:MAG: nucleotidyltransferase family protein [Maritimibacter sp.]|nr:nucleotidyltransferase family protein [Maritimibacter sp.]
MLGWSNLLATAVWPALDEDTRIRFRAELEGFAVAHALNTDRNGALLVQLERVVVRLNAAGIEPIILKGMSHLATGLWPTSGSRLVSDIDLLVAPDEMDPAFSALEDLAGIGPQDRGHPEVNARHKHMMPVIGAGGPAAVELHHALYAGTDARVAPPEMLRERAQTVGIGMGRAKILSPTDRVLTAMMHGPAGNGTYLVPTLQMRDMLDIRFLDRSHGAEIDWSWIQDHLSAVGWTAALEITNACLERFTGMPPPFAAPGLFTRLDAARWIRQMERDSRVLRQMGSAANHLNYTIGSLRAGGEPRRRILRKLVEANTYRTAFRRYIHGKEP